MSAGTYYENIIPLLAPIDKVAAAWATPWVDLKNAQACRFYLYHGLLTSASTDTVAVTIEAASEAGSDSEIAIKFAYRKGSAAGANAWGARTAATSTGFNLSTASDGLMWELEVDPVDVLNADTGGAGRYVRMVAAAPSDTVAAMLVSAWVVLEPRFKQLNMLSATGAAT